MPTYEYRCKKCKKTFEKLQSMNDSALRKCIRPKCGGTVERLIGAGAGFIFKGSGFYQTDYKKSSAPAPAEGGSASGGRKPEVKAEKKVDAPAKPDKKSEKKP